MDFTFNEEQRAVQEAADGIFSGLVTPDRVQQVEATEERFDRELWAGLARADLLGLSIPEAFDDDLTLPVFHRDPGGAATDETRTS